MNEWGIFLGGLGAALTGIAKLVTAFKSSPKEEKEDDK